MRNRFETGPTPDNSEAGLNAPQAPQEVDAPKETEGTVPEAPETTGEADPTDVKRTEKEMGEKEAEVRPEIEARFKDALSLLYLRIQLSREKTVEFPDKDTLRELIEAIPVFAKMQEGAKRMFLPALDKEPEFRSTDEEEFVNKGMEALGLLIDLATLKQGGDAWLQAKAEERARARQPGP